MIFGYFLFVVGYALFYWGWHHFHAKRYSLWALLGWGTLFGGKPPPIGAVQDWTTGGIPTSSGPGASPTSRSPVGSGLKMGRTDQGVDWSGKGPLYAVGAGTIINLYNTGWPGGTFIVLKLDNPQGLPSPDVYYAEDITPNVKIGQHVNAGDVIGTATGGPSGIEIGWADAVSIGQALAHGQYKEGVPTQLGQSFKNWITGGNP